MKRSMADQTHELPDDVRAFLTVVALGVVNSPARAEQRPELRQPEFESAWARTCAWHNERSRAFMFTAGKPDNRLALSEHGERMLATGVLTVDGRGR